MKYECHGHIILDGESYAGAVKRHEAGVDEAFVRGNFEILREHGISFFRDGGDKHMVSAFAKKIAPEYGVDYRTPIFIIHKKGYYGHMFGCGFGDMREYCELVREAKDLGADFIKITVSGMLDFSKDGEVIGPSLSFGEIREAVNIAGGEGFAVMAHVNGAENIKNALEAGVKSIEHGFWPDVDIIPYLLETGAVWAPTCATVYNLIGAGMYLDGVLSKIFETQAEVLREAYGCGAAIASGSDSGAHGVYQGSGTDDEYAILASLGINPERGNRMIAETFKRG